ncbi:MAG: Spy/CpxP family protein refolding chaperone [Rikenellaceae bacterium]|nr:Spy/CpxP family protein refolding chaperone [Rikenellaceae bacterium]
MKKTLSLLIMFAIVATLSAQETHKEMRKTMMPATERGYMKADPQKLAPKFTDDQKKQMADFKLAHDKQMIQINNMLGEKKAQLKTLQLAEKPDMKKINAKIDEITDLINQKMKISADHRNKVRSILTEEQKVRMDMMHERQHNPQAAGIMHKQVQMRRVVKSAGCNNVAGKGEACGQVCCKDGAKHKATGCNGTCKEAKHGQSGECCEKDSVKVIKVNK